MRDFEKFDRRFSFFSKFVMGAIVLVWLGILAFWSLVGFTTYNVIQDPSIVGKTVGKAVGGYKETVDGYRDKLDQLERRIK